MSTKTLAVASANPVKINAAEQALSRAFTDTHWQVNAQPVPSGVAEQPLSEAETRRGAEQRLQALMAQCPQADFFAAIEGGYDRIQGQPFTFAYIAISDGKRTQVGRTGTLPLPESIGQALEQGGELGPLMDQLFNDHNIKQKGGAIGVLTQHLVDRTGIYRDTLCLLLAPWLHPELFR
ncbi:inosine/xanthosine triphosphatase [Ferrimonas marina]|uniref:inosine/xanthosine triphosphatase n=1 Tax=Ferrimonas marina TaxID=299255 RepID=A0A1M5ZLK0_9GAMM|nr:inosine/xanthosine triphosphatase [Ferrimonas marina]SHI25032.1 inosine/xanthosine triphosphatase [Ferrimonas marina]